MKDTGGWRSKGIPTRCPKCGETGTQIETTIYGKTSAAFYCNTCSNDWKAPRDVRDVSGVVMNAD